MVLDYVVRKVNIFIFTIDALWSLLYRVTPVLSTGYCCADVASGLLSEQDLDIDTYFL